MVRIEFKLTKNQINADLEGEIVKACFKTFSICRLKQKVVKLVLILKLLLLQDNLKQTYLYSKYCKILYRKMLHSGLTRCI